jgi:hypothetical protein
MCIKGETPADKCFYCYEADEDFVRLLPDGDARTKKARYAAIDDLRKEIKYLLKAINL